MHYHERLALACRHQEAIITTAIVIWLGREPLGITREHGGFAYVVQAAEEHDHTLHADAGAAMGGCPIAEAVHIILDALHFNTLLLCHLCSIIATLIRNYLDIHPVTSRYLPWISTHVSSKLLQLMKYMRMRLLAKYAHIQMCI